MTDNAPVKRWNASFTAAGCMQEHNGDLIRSGIGPYVLAEDYDRITAREKALREALLGAVDCIREWHNSGLHPGERSHMWDIYWRNAPEMKKIRAALKDQP